MSKRRQTLHVAFLALLCLQVVLVAPFHGRRASGVAGERALAPGVASGESAPGAPLADRHDEGTCCLCAVASHLILPEPQGLPVAAPRGGHLPISSGSTVSAVPLAAPSTRGPPASPSPSF